MTFSSQFRSRKKAYEPAVLLEGSYRSRLELKLATQLEAGGFAFDYEKLKLRYEVPAKGHVYTPDFDLKNGIIVEAKGWLTTEDRTKMVHVKNSNPGIDIRFVFQTDPTKKFIRKGSPTSYAKWCEKNGFPWAGGGVIPQDWAQGEHMTFKVGDKVRSRRDLSASGGPRVGEIAEVTSISPAGQYGKAEGAYVRFDGQPMGHCADSFELVEDTTEYVVIHLNDLPKVRQSSLEAAKEYAQRRCLSGTSYMVLKIETGFEATTVVTEIAK